MMRIDLTMSVRSGVTQKNTVPSRGKKNALGLPAAHVQNALMMMMHNAKVLVTRQKESSVLRSSVAKNNARDAANAQVSVHRQNRQ
jgi:hypothetical protein